MNYATQLYRVGGGPSGDDRDVTSGDTSATPLSSRTFAAWNFLSAMVRIHAAVDISNRLWYGLAVWTYAIAVVHFATEWLVFGTAAPSRDSAGPGLALSTASLVWMLWCREGYVC
jgi:hypothetical protein